MPQYLAKISEKNFVMDKEEARHLKVARIRAGQEIKIFDGLGKKYLAVLSQLTDKTASGKIIKDIPTTEVNRKVYLYFSAVARTAAEDIIDKCTQCGVCAFVPVLSQFSEKDLLKKWTTKTERWHQLALAACKQCENPLIPQIMPPLSFTEAVKSIKMPAIICYEDEHKTPILEQLKTIKSKQIAVFIGPEGGYSEEEILLAKKYDIKSVTLGRNILRAETAAAAASWAAMQ